MRAVLPLGQGIVLDPFADAGSTLAAAEALGYTSMGVENDPVCFHMASAAIPKLVKYIPNGEDYSLYIQCSRNFFIPSLWRVAVLVPSSPRGFFLKSSIESLLSKPCLGRLL